MKKMLGCGGGGLVFWNRSIVKCDFLWKVDIFTIGSYRNEVSSPWGRGCQR